MLPTEEDVAEYGGESAPAKQAASEAEPAGESPQAQTPAAPGESRTEAEEWKEKFLRAKADLANYQRRTEKDRAEVLRYANAGLVQKLLPILDDIERVIASGSEQGSGVEAVVGGVKLTLENFLKVLGDFNVSRIESEGQPFDPAVHEAMMQRPSDEHGEPTVLEEVVKGYRLGDRVLRPARVVVSKPPDSDEDTRQEGEARRAASEKPDGEGGS